MQENQERVPPMQHTFEKPNLQSLIDFFLRTFMASLHSPIQSTKSQGTCILQHALGSYFEYLNAWLAAYFLLTLIINVVCATFIFRQCLLLTPLTSRNTLGRFPKLSVSESLPPSISFLPSFLALLYTPPPEYNEELTVTYNSH